MVVDDLDIKGCSVMPPEANLPLLVDAKAVLPTPIALQRFEAIAGRYPQIVQGSCLVQRTQLAQSDRLDLQGQPPASPAKSGLFLDQQSS
jgi:hypothetical protein